MTTFVRANRAAAFPSRDAQKPKPPIASKPSPTNMVKVRILNTGVYANVLNRAVSVTAGDVLETGAQYAASLVADGLATFEPVEVNAEAVPVAVVTSESSVEELEAAEQSGKPIVVSGPATGWASVYATLDTSDSIKRKLWDAGFTSKEVLRQQYLQSGLNNLEAIKGVTRNTAFRVMQWSGELEEALLNDLVK